MRYHLWIIIWIYVSFFAVYKRDKPGKKTELNLGISLRDSPSISYSTSLLIYFNFKFILEHIWELRSSGLLISGLFVCFWRYSRQWAMASSFTRFLDHTHQRTTISRTPLEEWSARRRDLYMTTHTTLTTDKRPCRRWDSNPQSQQGSGRRPTP